MVILIPVPLPRIVIYAAAYDLLHPILGAKTPSVADLVSFEMSRRRPVSIAEEFLEHHGYPTLRTGRHKQGAKRAAPKGKTGRVPVLATRALRRPLAQGDPSRN